MKKDLYTIIMAGGIGSRFWPMSKSSYPKQFLDILGTGKTLIQATYNRFVKICPPENIFIVTNEDYVSLVKEQLPGIRSKQILGEPARRNTAPCIAYASFKISKINPNASIIVAPSDHVILQEKDFIKTARLALEEALTNDILITLGIRPGRPDTGYGYIQYVEEKRNGRFCKVKTFTEKPDIDLAKSFIKSGDFLWNAGIFVWNVQAIITAFQKHLPAVYEIFKDGIAKMNTREEKKFIKKAYTHCKNVSIDYGVMEKAKNVYVVPSDFGWSDVGTWGSLYELHDKDYVGNAVGGKNVMMYDSSDCIVKVPDEKLVILQGLSDYIVIESEETLLICKKEAEQQIKQIVADVKKKKGKKFV